MSHVEIIHSVYVKLFIYKRISKVLATFQTINFPLSTFTLLCNRKSIWPRKKTENDPPFRPFYGPGLMQKNIPNKQRQTKTESSDSSAD